MIHSEYAPEFPEMIRFDSVTIPHGWIENEFDL